MSFISLLLDVVNQLAQLTGNAEIATLDTEVDKACEIANATATDPEEQGAALQQLICNTVEDNRQGEG